MKKVIRMVISAVLVSSPLAIATSAKATKKKAPIVLACEGVESPVKVVVYDHLNGHYSAKVWNDGDLLKHEVVTKNFIVDGEDYSEEVRLIFASASSVLDGGFNIRVIVVKPEAPEIAGEGHITVRIDEKMRNPRLECVNPGITT